MGRWSTTALADGAEAMLLYDMDVAQLGTMRIAEHFTVAGGKISRIRQIHDTVAIRAAFFPGEQASITQATPHASGPDAQ